MNEQQNNGNIILYQTEDGKSRIEVTLCNDTVWLTTDQMAELFQTNLPFPDILRMYSRTESWIRTQLLHFLQQLPLTIKNIKWHTIILT